MPNTITLLIILLIVETCFFIFLLRRLNLKNTQQEKELKQCQLQTTITQRRLAFDKNELNAILSSLVEGVLVIASNDSIQYISPNLSDMFDFRSKKVTDKAYWEVIGRNQIIGAIKESLTGQCAVSREIMILGAKDIVFHLQISPVMQSGKLMSVVAIFHDITELKRLIKMRSEFVANVSHELKTPLTSIKGYVETLAEPGALEDKETVSKFFKIIHKQTLRLEALVKDLLTLSAIESKEVAMDMQPCDLATIAHSVVNVLKAQIQNAQQKVTLNIPSNLGQVILDRNQIEQVLINLVDNAVKFTPKGGSIEISVVDQNPYIRVDVKDSGIGIEPQHLPRLFERFYRVDKSRSTELGGTGLGLAIVKHIVLAHQGKVEVQSKAGVGSTFSVFLPLRKS